MHTTMLHHQVSRTSAPLRTRLTRPIPKLLFSVTAVVAALAAPAPGAHAAGPVVRVDVASDGTQANDSGLLPMLSHDGRYAVFYSNATNLVPNDTNERGDIFVHDRHTAKTARVSVGNGGVQGNGASNTPSISGDGRYVAFVSFASNLVTGDTNGTTDVFVHDRQTATTTRVNLAGNGVQANNISFDVHISRNGRYLAYMSRASNLVEGDTNGVDDIFVHDRETGATSRVSVASDGAQGNQDSETPRISGDGRFVTFVSKATNLVAGDTNNSKDVFVHDRQTGQTSRVNVATGTGAQAVCPEPTCPNGISDSLRPSLSDDGRRVVFMSTATNLVAGDTNNAIDVFVHDRTTGTTVRANVTSNGVQGGNQGIDPSISADGTLVAFSSVANNLVPNDNNSASDIFVHNLETKTTVLASLTGSGAQPNNTSDRSSISGNGRFVVFSSFATNLVSGDTNGKSDIFVADRLGTVFSSTVTLQGRSSTSPGNGHALASVSLSDGSGGPVNAQGVASFGVVDGATTITACASGYLCASRQITIAGGMVQGGLPPVQLAAGLVDGDTDVDIQDVVAIINAYGTRPTNRVDAQGRYVDMNGDGVVNIKDLTLTLGNFGKTSPTAWP